MKNIAINKAKITSLKVVKLQGFPKKTTVSQKGKILILICDKEGKTIEISTLSNLASKWGTLYILYDLT